MSATILSKVVACLEQFENLQSSGLLKPRQVEVPDFAWHDELGRLRIWVSNTGADDKYQFSLDYRLRNAAHIKTQVIRQLDRLQRILEDLQLVLEKPVLEDASGSDTEDEGAMKEARSIYRNLLDNINCLHQISILTQEPAPLDQIADKREEDKDIFESVHRDWELISKIFPRANVSIVHQLGITLAKRRAHLKYRERQHKQLNQGLVSSPDNLESELDVLCSAIFSDPSTSSYAFYDPPCPAGYNDPFQCPYCFYIIRIEDQESWAKHFWDDLMPYACMFPSCSIRLYEKEQDWVNHLQQKHPDLKLCCMLCEEDFSQDHQYYPFARHFAQHLKILSLFVLRDMRNESEEKLLVSSD